MRWEVANHVLPGSKCHGGSTLFRGGKDQNGWSGKQIYRLEGFNEYCSPEIPNPTEAVEGGFV